jgi:tetratricopeptide (TPR) repeat protein
VGTEGSPDDGIQRAIRALLAEGQYEAVVERYAPASAAEAERVPAQALGAATAATRLGRLADGEWLASAALAAFRRRADEDGRMRCLNLLGAIAYERGQLDRSAVHFRAALDLGRVLGDLQGWARAANNLASVALLRSRIEDARAQYVEAQLAYQRLGDRRGLAETYHNMGVVARELGQLAESARVADESVRHAEVVGDRSLLAMAVIGEAEVALAGGDWALARERVDRAELLARTAGEPLVLVEVNRVRAQRWLAVAEPERALAVVEPARAEAGRLGSAQLQGECAMLAGQALAALGRTPEAGAKLAEARRIFEGLGATLLLRRLPANVPAAGNPPESPAN